MDNFFKDLPSGTEEIIQPILASGEVRIERIVSHGQPSPPDFWYEQEQDEWVLLLRGWATLEYAGGKLVQMVANDYIRIPAYTEHRVAEVSQDAVWLAVHF
jgi:cupin 2 domain-containing protein